MDIQEQEKKYSPYFGRIIGSIAGLVVAILIITIGFWYTFIITCFVGIGFIIGMWNDGVFSITGLFDLFKKMTERDDV